MKSLITNCPHCTRTLTAAEAIENWCTRCERDVKTTAAGRKEAA